MNNRRLKLTARDRLELCNARGATLQIARGAVWVSQPGERSDVVLRAGDSWALERYGLTVVKARGDAEVTLVGHADARVRLHRAPWQQRFARWLERAGERQMRPRWVPWV